MSEPVTTSSGSVFQLPFIRGTPPPGAGPCLYLTRDGAIHAGEILPHDGYACGKALRTTNPTGGLHDVFDIPASDVIGYADAGQRRGVF